MIRGAHAQEAPARPTNLVDMLDEMVEPPEPLPISLMPQTTGWWVLAVLLVLLLGWALWRWLHRHRANAYRRAALAVLQEEAITGADVATTLRRAALAAFPRTRVAGLSGPDWLAFLNQTGGNAFSGAVGQELVAAPYLPETAPASSELVEATRRWLRVHSAEAPANGAEAAPASEVA